MGTGHPVSKSSGAANAEVSAVWLKRARQFWNPIFFRQRRFRNPYGDDELMLDVARAREWLISDPCPNAFLAGHLEAMLDAYGEMPTATVEQLVELRHIVGESAEAILEWEKDPRQSASD
jgi:hypothetical protein